jgi:hypothetical protein
VIRFHSRPRQSNDNPYIEAQFKTLKYFPTFPDRFTSIQHSRPYRSRSRTKQRQHRDWTSCLSNRRSQVVRLV